MAVCLLQSPECTVGTEEVMERQLGANLEVVIARGRVRGRGCGVTDDLSVFEGM